jgi:hypothetical protein
MTTQRFRVWSLSALFFLSCLAAACFGTAARDNLLLPSMGGSWSKVRPMVERELARVPNAEAAAAVVEVDKAIDTGPPARLAAVRWPLLEQLAEDDIARRLAAGEIGPGVATSLRGLLADLAESRAQYLRQRP